ncbi:MAG TPA: DUF1326 domain-containing protein [Acidobacteriota bacterium]|nr:DUF1326 domain-containing protein [Acidobacteriota bacterium]
MRRWMLALFLLGSTASVQASDRVVGDYLEVRSNHVYTCGCLYSGELVTGGREAIVAWNLREGELAGRPLNDVRAVAVLMGATTLSLGESPRVTVLYLDGYADDDQRAAVLSWLKTSYHDLLGEILEIHDLPIRFSKTEDFWEVEAQDDVHVRIRRTRLPDDAHLGSFRWFDPFVSLSRSELVTSLIDEYNGPDLGMRWARWDHRISGFRGEFVAEEWSPQGSAVGE